MRKTFIKKILREGLNLPYKNLSTPELWFKDLLNQMDTYKSPDYPNSIFFHINKDVYMQYTKNTKFLYYDYNQIYSVLASKFELNSNQIIELVKGMVEEHYKLEIDTTATIGNYSGRRWRNIIN
jgi:hypothetical protein